ncbi:MAG TPA: sugar phosphate isomerase/epimerase family protein [Solirubrobacteraceae bacterium]|nr:sugar phosphate isomerase/epimerase family protein [Solirubrobacteraceae bacterium]
MTPRISVSQISTFRSSFADDVRDYAAAGLDGIGIWEMKLPDGGDAESLELLEASGLERASAVTAVPSILPMPLLGPPDDPAERLHAYCASLERLAAFAPAAVVCVTGSGAGRDPDEARSIVVEGLRTIGAEAQRLGLRIALEPYQRIDGEPWSIVFSIPEAIELLRDAGDPPAIGIQFDVWHLWNTPTLFDDIASEIGRFAGVHVCDYRDPPRAWADRALPGEGVAGVPAILAALDAAGWDGLYDVEIFSDDGTFGTELPDSHWAAPALETLARARDAVRRSLSPALNQPTKDEVT